MTLTDPSLPDVDRSARERPVLVTGASGYIGGRLVSRLLAAGYRCRCLARSPQKLAGRAWASRPGVEIVGGDAGDGERLAAVMHGCGAAFYLVHSMHGGAGYAGEDRRLARSFADAAAAAGIERIVYLGGLGETGAGLSEHLASRREVEHELAAGPVPVTVLRAAMIIGSGSASFEILRYLTERLPVMITPRWVDTECQPIAVRDVLRYLVECLDRPETAGATLEIGGSDVVTYRELMQATAAALGLRPRLVLPVPVLTPRLSSLWIHLVTPLSHRIARPLAEGLRNRVVVGDDRARRLMPGPLLGVREAIAQAVSGQREGALETSWSDAGAMPGDPDWAGGTVFEDRREIVLAASPGEVFGAVVRIGGGNGWYAADFLWRVRGLLDRLAGGPGLRRGRRDPEALVYGDALDFWRVIAIEAYRRLELHAEMRLPGAARLGFEIEPLAGGRVRLVQTARFRPSGLLGLAYWYAVLPFHGFVFRGMLTGIRRAVAGAAGGEGPASTRDRRAA